uniref:Uncharacterized protein n=1 Tax=Schizaphis graminum TaxID=13262 RepID=A0A2S2NR21_SCHGA
MCAHAYICNIILYIFATRGAAHLKFTRIIQNLQYILLIIICIFLRLILCPKLNHYYIIVYLYLLLVYYCYQNIKFIQSSLNCDFCSVNKICFIFFLCFTLENPGARQILQIL